MTIADRDRASAIVSSSPKIPHPPWWMPKLWHGMSFPAWWGLLTRNRFAFAWWALPLVCVVTVYSLGNSLLRGLQSLIFGRQIARTVIKQQPLFILGHWRTGTSFLHELLGQDSRLTFPTTYECFCPNHFLLSEWIVSKCFGFMLPAQRLPDRMKISWSHPQEDEAALGNLGCRSPYLTFAFPNHPPQDQEYLELTEVPPPERERWKSIFHRFLVEITCRRPRRIVLKSPTHTCRIRTLLEVFPDARFVYLVRNPYTVFPSTLHLWRVMYSSQGLQQPTFAGLEEHVLATFQQMHAAVQRDRSLVPADRFCEVRYEDLVRAPLAQLKRIYAELELVDFDQAAPAVEQYLNEQKSYETNHYSLTAEQQATIAARWKSFIEQYGYALPRPSGSAGAEDKRVKSNGIKLSSM